MTVEENVLLSTFKYNCKLTMYIQCKLVYLEFCVIIYHQVLLGCRVREELRDCQKQGCRVRWGREDLHVHQWQDQKKSLVNKN